MKPDSPFKKFVNEKRKAKGFIVNFMFMFPSLKAYKRTDFLTNKARLFTDAVQYFKSICTPVSCTLKTPSHQQPPPNINMKVGLIYREEEER
jgi:hypothetical protein